jgi:hypothetical protein
MTLLKNIYDKMPFTALFKALLSETCRLRAIQSAQFRHLLLQSDPRFLDPLSLARYEHQVFSQSGEDGVIREIFRRIGTTNRYFVEFGVENGLENNTHFLLQQGWRGSWIEGSEPMSRQIREAFHSYLDQGTLSLLNSFVTAENISQLFSRLKVPLEFDLLSIDIDGNDYWIWKALDQWKPRVITVEYNGRFPPDYEWVMPYNASHCWDGNSHFGASLKSLELIGRAKGYKLVYCNFAGSNSFFIRADVAHSYFQNQNTAEYHFQPFRPYLITRG